MANSVQRLLHITQSIEEILTEHLQRSRIKRLFSPNSGEQLLKQCREKLQSVLEILHILVDSRVETAPTGDNVNEQLTYLQELPGFRDSQIYGSAPSRFNLYSNSVSQTVPDVAATEIRHYSVTRRSTNIYIQDNSLVIDGSGNNVNMRIIGVPHRNN